MGDARACRPHLHTSELVAAKLSEHHGRDETSYIQPGLVEIQVAEALRRLGDLSAAQGYAEESVRTATSTHLRGQVHRYAGLALVLAVRGDLDRTVHLADQMLDRAEGMESGRIHDRINQVVQALHPHAGEPIVAAFLERANEHLKLKGI